MFWDQNPFEKTSWDFPMSGITTSKLGRNESCPCGSGKKYKKCCGRLCEALSRASGEPVEFMDFSVERGTPEPTISLRVQNQPAREILRGMLRQVSSTTSWHLLYDPDLKTFVLTFRFP